MQNETRINLKHLLEDIRDSYSSPIEEVIITELVANALDSGATRVDFVTNVAQLKLTCIDNGKGMNRAQFREYHNIASSTKTRGEGIGFAGVGAKLSLIISDKVVSETRGPHGGRCASEWKLTSSFRAPWKFVPSSDTIPHARGTSVSIFLRSSEEKLLDTGFIERAIAKHFYPLLNAEMMEKILSHVYKKGVEFYVNEKRAVLPEDAKRHNDKWFEVRFPKQRRPIGYGFIAIKDAEASWMDKITGGRPAPLSLSSGLTISTYGKIIKSGWEWTGVSPKSKHQLVGIVEIPAMSQLLTTNKDGFLSDSASLKKYYRYRKSIQEAVLPVLKIFGEDQVIQDEKRPETYMKPLARQIEDALDNLINDFPELEAVIGTRRTAVKASADNDLKRAPATDDEPLQLGLESDTPKNLSPERDMGLKTKPDKGGDKAKRVNRSGLKIALESFTGAESTQLGRIIDDTAHININHAAWTQAVQQHWEECYVAFAVALLLYDFVAVGRNPQEFVSKFLLELSQRQKPLTLV